MEAKSFDAGNLSNQYVNDEVTDRVLTCHIADLAVQLAMQFGEPLQRPLTKEQIERAVEVNSKERSHVFAAMRTRWENLYLAGELHPASYSESIERSSQSS